MSARPPPSGSCHSATSMFGTDVRMRASASAIVAAWTTCTGAGRFAASCSAVVALTVAQRIVTVATCVSATIAARGSPGRRIARSLANASRHEPSAEATAVEEPAAVRAGRSMPRASSETSSKP